MSSLHTIARSPISNLLGSCTPLLAQNDALLFLEDGVIYASRADLIGAIPGKRKLYALKEDVIARGLQNKIVDTVEVISTRKFVALCCDHDKVVNWF